MHKAILEVLSSNYVPDAGKPMGHNYVETAKQIKFSFHIEIGNVMPTTLNWWLSELANRRQIVTLVDTGGKLNQPPLFSNVHFSMKKRV